MTLFYDNNYRMRKAVLSAGEHTVLRMTPFFESHLSHSYGLINEPQFTRLLFAITTHLDNTAAFDR
jgi:hypothetical protein